MTVTVQKSLDARIMVDGLASEDRVLDMVIELSISYNPYAQVDPEYDYSVSYRVVRVGESLGIDGFEERSFGDMDLGGYKPPVFGALPCWSFYRYDLLETSELDGRSVWSLYVDLLPEEVVDERGIFTTVVHVDVCVEERSHGGVVVYK